MATYYHLASTSFIEGYKETYPGPYDISISFDSKTSPAILFIGTGHYFSGGYTSLKTVLGSKEVLRETQSEWLIPFLERMANGEDVQAEVLHTFENIHGRPPSSRTDIGF